MTTRKLIAHDDTLRAVYVDFECLTGDPPLPILLGILRGADENAFRQLILDKRLTEARVARSRLRLSSTAQVVEDLLRETEQEDLPIVGWSFFDRARLIEACGTRADEIRRRYVNALHIARPWRRTIYPAVTIAREDPHAPKHTLDKYAALAGYPAPAGFSKATPAKWIRHALKQVHAKGGQYRPTTPQTKRDWHRLIEYNRHDCLALRHIVLQATRDLDSWSAYERTTFYVFEGAREARFRPGWNPKPLEALLHRHRATRWALITAWNPRSVPLAAAENDRRQRALRADVEASGYRWLRGEGRGDDPSWTPEESLFILDISEAKAVGLGRKYGQLAIVVGRRGEPASLVSCAAIPTAQKSSLGLNRRAK